MKVFRKVNENRVQSLTLTASTPEDHELLAALYLDYTQKGMLEITLRSGRLLKSVFTEQRRSPRISRQLPVRIVWEDGKQERREQTFTLNLSRFGCSILSHTFFQPHTTIRLHFGEKMIVARTVYSLMDHASGRIEVGIDFGRDGCDFWEILMQDQ